MTLSAAVSLRPIPPAFRLIRNTVAGQQRIRHGARPQQAGGLRSLGAVVIDVLRFVQDQQVERLLAQHFRPPTPARSAGRLLFRSGCGSASGWFCPGPCRRPGCRPGRLSHRLHLLERGQLAAQRAQLFAAHPAQLRAGFQLALYVTLSNERRISSAVKCMRGGGGRKFNQPPLSPTSPAHGLAGDALPAMLDRILELVPA